MPPALAAVWIPAMVRPFYKLAKEGTKIRPVICAEVLLKIPIGALVQELQTAIEDACGPRQYGAGRSGGASIQIAEVRTAARLRPQMAIVALDVKNAFGSVTWPHALEAYLRLVPDFAPALAGQWINKTLPIYTQTAPNKWSKQNLYGSLLQGGQDGHPVFCLVLTMALTRAAHRFEGHALYYEQQRVPARAHMWRQIMYWAYVDDITVQVPVEILASTLSILTEEMATLNLILEPTKCKC